MFWALVRELCIWVIIASQFNYSSIIMPKDMGAQPNRRSKVITRTRHYRTLKLSMKNKVVASELLPVWLCDFMSPHLSCPDLLQACLASKVSVSCLS